LSVYDNTILYHIIEFNMPIITEEETDDVLYCARANEIEELKNFVPTLFPKYGTQPAWIISQAVDAETGNTALHYASANGHDGQQDKDLILCVYS
jgi:hypothetical protein